MSNWIFCKDRLPSEYSRYLVVYPLSSIDIKPYIIDILNYGFIHSDKPEPCFYTIDSEFGEIEYDDVIAWMPLPELWEEADDK